MGSGYRNFVAGERPTADMFNGFLMRQTVMTFASLSAATTALAGVLDDEGMVIFIEDKDQLLYYTGAAWVVVGGRCGGRWSRVANQSATGSALTTITWDTETDDSDGFLTPASANITVPSGMGGFYAVTARLVGESAFATTGSYIRINLSSINYDFSAPAVPASGLMGSVTGFVASSAVITVAVFNADAAKNVTGTVQVQRVSP